MGRARPPPDGVDPVAWESLCDKVRDRRCVPIIGAAARHPPLDSAQELADWLGREYEYPLLDTADLAQVAQYVRSTHDKPTAHEAVAKRLDEQLQDLDVTWAGENHALRAIAEMEFPLYVTTSYDDLLTRALRTYAGVEPRVAVCPWRSERLEVDDLVDAELAGFAPTPDTPLVLHLHGSHATPESMVLTETDHMAFNMQLADDRRHQILPDQVREALATGALLFVGYWHADRNFRGLLHSLSAASRNRRESVAVQVEESKAAPGRLEDARQFLASYFGTLRGEERVHVYWGSADEFLVRLRECAADDDDDEGGGP